MRKREKQTVSDDGTYIVKKSKKLDVLAFILCAILAFGVWVYVMNTQNADYTKTFSLTVDIVNADGLYDDTGLALYGLSRQSATVTVKGTKSDIRKFVEKDFRAYIDASSISAKGTFSAGVVVETPTAAISVVSIEPSSFLVYADYAVSKTPFLEVGCQGNDNIKVEFAEEIKGVAINGPRTYVDQISTIRIYIPNSSSYQIGEIVTTSTVKFYDSNGVEISAPYISLARDSFAVKIKEIIDE